MFSDLEEQSPSYPAQQTPTRKSQCDCSDWDQRDEFTDGNASAQRKQDGSREIDLLFLK